MELKRFVHCMTVFVCLCVLSGFGIAQEEAAWIDPLAPPHDLIIKGSEQPDLIPLGLCYHVFFRTLAKEAAEGDQGQERARTLLRKAGVAEQSLDAFLTLAANYEVEVSAIASEAQIHKDRYLKNRNAQAGTALRSLDKRRDRAAMGLLGLATAAVGELEAQKIHRYVDQVVRRQVAIGGADAAIALNQRACPDCRRAPR